MAQDGKHDVPENVRETALEVLRYEAEIGVVKHTIQKLIEDLKSLTEEAEVALLDQKFGFDSRGKRVLKEPRAEAMRIAQELQVNPGLTNGVINCLRQKLNRCQSERRRLCEQLDNG